MITGFYKGGFGRATHELSYHVLQVGIKFLIVSEVAYIATSAFVKLSVAVLQLRIIGTANTTMRRINFLSTAVNVLLSVYTFFILLFHCNPPRRAWDRDINGGHCLSKDLILTSAHVWSGVSIGLDVYYAVGLIPLIWGLQIPRAVKFSTTIILGLGIFASVATIARFKYIIGFVGNRDPLGTSATHPSPFWLLNPSITIITTTSTTTTTINTSLHIQQNSVTSHYGPASKSPPASSRPAYTRSDHCSDCSPAAWASPPTARTTNRTCTAPTPSSAAAPPYTSCSPPPRSRSATQKPMPGWTSTCRRPCPSATTIAHSTANACRGGWRWVADTAKA
ncbi:hypothetical protein IWX48DRAFT_218680 [Phyllosticta citricarpa]